MNRSHARCLILACGNTLRGDDGVGPWLADWVDRRFHAETDVCSISRQQWTPELAEDIAQSESVIFIDCSALSAPGELRLVPVEPAREMPRLLTHHLAAADLLALGRDFYSSAPRKALLLTIGAGSLELHEGFSEPVGTALPDACLLLEDTVLRLLTEPQIHEPSQRR